MSELGEEFDRIAALVDERLTWRDYLSYYWNRTKCAMGRHHFHTGWLGGRICVICGRIQTEKPRINLDAYLMCVVTGISAAAILSIPAFR